MKFMAIDGEGFMDDDGIHRYKLLGIGQDQLSNDYGLGFDEIMTFLYDHYEKDTAYIGFFLDYDFTQWLKNLPENRARMLLTIEGKAKRKRKVKGDHSIAPHPVEYDEWQFDLLGYKRFRLRPKMCNCPVASCPCKPKRPWMYICDVGGFFQTSFLNVINPSAWPEPIVTQEEFDTILEGKAQRSSAMLDSDTALYNRLENEVLERVMTVYANGLEAIDVRLTASKWFGPGQAAQEWMRGRAPKRTVVEEAVPQWFRDMAQWSYYGGWFELMMHGIIPGKTHEYDVNSAYPAIIAELPCLIHATYTRGIGKPMVLPGELCLVKAWVWSQPPNRTDQYHYNPKKMHIGAMLHRMPDGSILRPSSTQGWFWWHELEAAKRAGCITRISDDRFFEWAKFTPGQCPPDCHPNPMREVRSLYNQRLAVGKDSPMGKGAKTVYNSDYGKFAQSIGSPLYGNPIYASLITAGCRIMILDAIATHPKGKSNVAMVATDAVYFLDEHPELPLSDKLGEWEHKIKRNLTLFKPGFYWDDTTREQIAAGKTPVFKARGIPAASFKHEIARVDAQFRKWTRDDNGKCLPHGRTPDILEPIQFRRTEERVSNHGTWPSVSFQPGFCMTTALQALMQNNWKLAGTVTEGENTEPLTQNAWPGMKRTNAYSEESRERDKYGFDSEYKVYRSEPVTLGPKWWCTRRLGIFHPEESELYISTPYEKRFGSDDPFSDESRQQSGISPDGYVSDAFTDILYGKGKE
jgi:hypothetical protein